MNRFSPSGNDKIRNHRIVGGRDIYPGQLSWQVFLYDLNDSARCGGSIINRLFVLTANHCNINHWIPCDALKDKQERIKCETKRNILNETLVERRERTKEDYKYPSNILGILFKFSFRNCSWL